jgi:putative ABC transport system substrate-binding protein
VARSSRRQFLQIGLAFANSSLILGCGGLAFPARPTTKVPTIGFVGLGNSPATGSNPNYDAFLGGLGELGWVDGQTLTLHSRLAEGRADRIPDLVADLLRLPLDVVVSSGAAGALVAAKATSTVPIVFASAANPIEEGLVCSLARPCANVTGLSNLAEGLDGKRVELLQESIGGIARLGVLWHQPSMLSDFGRVEAAAQARRIEVLSMAVADSDGILAAFQAAVRDRVQAVVTVSNGLTLSARGSIVELANRYRMPSIYQTRDFIQAGGLMAYGPNLVEQHRRAASYVDRILKGARPADLPVEQPTTFEFTINLRTAQALGLAIPHSILAQATDVIH